MNIFLRNRIYRNFISADAFAYIGRTLFDMVFIIYASNFSNAKLAVSIVSLITALPYATDFILGYLADTSAYKIDSILKNRIYQIILFILFTITISFKPNWLVFSIVVIVNVVADLIGGYNSYVSLSVYSKIIDEDDLDRGLAFKSSILSSISLISKTGGIFLLVALNYNYTIFGSLNVLMYFLSFILIFINKKILKEATKSIKTVATKISIRKFIKDTKDNFKILKNTQILYQYVVLFSVMNFYSSGMYTIFLLLIATNNDFHFKNLAYTIALIETIEVSFSILAGFFPIGILRKIKFKNNILLEVSTFIFYVINLIFIKNKILLIIIIAIEAYLGGISGPKLDAFLLKAVPSDKQTSIYSIYSSIITIAVPIATVLFIFFANSIGLLNSLYILFFITLFLLFYTIKLKVV